MRHLAGAGPHCVRYQIYEVDGTRASCCDHAYPPTYSVTVMSLIASLSSIGGKSSDASASLPRKAPIGIPYAKCGRTCVQTTAISLHDLATFKANWRRLGNHGRSPLSQQYFLRLPESRVYYLSCLSMCLSMGIIPTHARFIQASVTPA